MSKAGVLDLALARSAWHSKVSIRLGAGNIRLNWSKTPLQALVNIDELHHADALRLTGVRSSAVHRGRIQRLGPEAPDGLGAGGQQLGTGCSAPQLPARGR